MDYYHDIWIGYLTGLIVQRCVELCVLRCPGCRDKLKSPVLHIHHQYSLLDKLKTYVDEIRGSLLPAINQLYDVAKNKLPHSDDPAKDMEIYTNNARFFLQTATPETLYYGRYLNEQNDCIINELLVQKPSKKKRNHPAEQGGYSKRQTTTKTARPSTLDLTSLLMQNYGSDLSSWMAKKVELFAQESERNFLKCETLLQVYTKLIPSSESIQTIYGYKKASSSYSIPHFWFCIFEAAWFWLSKVSQSPLDI